MNALASLLYQIAGPDHEQAEELLATWLQNDRFALAYGLLCEGFSVIPLLADGKQPAVRWKRYQTEFANVRDLAWWFVENDYQPAIVTGELSGITVIDCDSADAIDACIESGIESNIKQATKRGMHIVFQHRGERNTVRVNGIAGVDRRGQGGYVKAYPGSGSWTQDRIALCPTL